MIIEATFIFDRSKTVLKMAFQHIVTGCRVDMQNFFAPCAEKMMQNNFIHTCSEMQPLNFMVIFVIVRAGNCVFRDDDFAIVHGLHFR